MATMRTQASPRPPSAPARSRDGADPLVMVTAYDAPGARMADEAGVDLILVGDSRGHGRARLRRHAPGHRRRHGPPHRRAVARGQARAPLVVGDLPWMSYHVVRRATRCATPPRSIRAGAQAVKLEGGRKRLPMVEAIVDAEIPVMGHLGLTPQSVHAMGGFKVQGREHERRARAGRRRQGAGRTPACFAIVLEGVPDEVARMVTDAVDVPDHRHRRRPRLRRPGARVPRRARHRGPDPPKFVRRYADLKADGGRRRCRPSPPTCAPGAFPADAESYHLSAEVAETLGLYGGRRRRLTVAPCRWRRRRRRRLRRRCAGRAASSSALAIVGAAPTAARSRSAGARRRRPADADPATPSASPLDGFDEVAVTVEPADGGRPCRACLLLAAPTPSSAPRA